MYPNVFIDFIKFQNKYSDTSILPTPLFFYGPNIDQEYSLTIESGKNLIIRYLAKGETNINGLCSVFFELNGQPRTIEVEDRSYSNKKNIKILADINNPNHLGSPLPGQVSQIFIKDEDKIIKGDKVLIIEAMKMETIITAHKSGTIKSLQVKVGSNLDAKDLLLEID
jgi:pyruvate carboxylase